MSASEEESKFPPVASAAEAASPLPADTAIMSMPDTPLSAIGAMQQATPQEEEEEKHPAMWASAPPGSPGGGGFGQRSPRPEELRPVTKHGRRLRDRLFGRGELQIQF